LFWVLPAERHINLLRGLVAYEIILEFLDNLNERTANVGLMNAFQLHLALIEALDPGRAISDYYCYHPYREDGGYLRALVETCRAACASMSGYPMVRGLTIREATRAKVLAVNHDPDANRRDMELELWARQWFPGESAYSWFELTGAATSSLVIHMLLAYAADATASESDIEGSHSVYFPGLSLLTTMLDSYVDRPVDELNEEHSYISHYYSEEIAVQRLCQIIQLVLAQAQGLRYGHRHVVIAAAMIAMYLSSDSAREPARRVTTRQLAHAGGPLTRLLIPILRLWRVAYKLHAE
jgi:tetraprenyl-beta-curcumene synthase